MSEILPRIMGTETEFGLTVYDANMQPTGFLQEEIHAALPDQMRVAGDFLSNGARFYLDWNDKLEYSTPECKSAGDVIHAEIAGEQIVFSSLERLVHEGIIYDYDLNKRVIDHHNNTWGYHESYMLSRKIYQEKHEQLVALHIAQLLSRTILTGSGSWEYNDENPTLITPAQKLHSIEARVSNDTVTRKPIFNTRDSLYADSHLARLHTTCGDPNILPWAGWMKLGTTSIVLRLLETDTLNLNNLALAKPVQAAHKIANDIYGKESLLLESGKSTNALGLQKELLAQCQGLTDRGVLTKEELAVLAEWQIALDLFTDDPQHLVGKVDWLTRAHVLHSYFDKKLRGECNPEKVMGKLARVDLLWDNVDPHSGIGIKHFRSNAPFPGYSEQQAETLVFNPPSGTRARQRADFIRSIPDASLGNAEVGWNTVFWTDETHGYGVNMGDPYGRQKPETDAVEI